MLSAYFQTYKSVDDFKVVKMEDSVPYTINHILLYLYDLNDERYLLQLGHNFYIGFRSSEYGRNNLTGLFTFSYDQPTYHEGEPDELAQRSIIMYWSGEKTDHFYTAYDDLWKYQIEWMEEQGAPTSDELKARFNDSLPNIDLRLFDNYVTNLYDKIAETFKQFELVYSDFLSNENKAIPLLRFTLTSDDNWSYKEIGEFYSNFDYIIHKFRNEIVPDIDLARFNYHLYSMKDTVSADEEGLLTVVISLYYEVYKSQDFFAYMGPGYYRTFISNVCKGNFSTDDLHKWIDYFQLNYLIDEETGRIDVESVCKILHDYYTSDSVRERFLEMKEVFEK
jgi:hypothetical protein